MILLFKELDYGYVVFNYDGKRAYLSSMVEGEGEIREESIRNPDDLSGEIHEREVVDMMKKAAEIYMKLKYSWGG